MTRRNLTNEELVLENAGLTRNKEEKGIIEFELEHCNLMIDKGLEMNLKKKMREFKAIRSELEAQLKELNLKIKIAQDHISNGVVIKKEEEND